MDRLNPDLLKSEELSDFLFASPINGTNARGTYNPMQFVIRLRDDIHKVLKDITPGIHGNLDLSETEFQAFSTYLHENIHWWQHVGSNFGFISSLKFPVQAHIAHQDLLKLIETGQAFKSIVKYEKDFYSKSNMSDNPQINRIINNWFDIYFAGLISFDPKQVQKIINNKYFLNVGHTFHMLWSSTIQTLANSFDPKYTFLPDILKWKSEFEKLEEEKVQGFYVGSDVGIPPFGTKAIFEGQARFIQLQYLYFALEKKLDFNDFDNIGMLSGIYNEAFDFYLKVLNEKRPSNPDSPIVALFLLICDIAINPTEGFPLNVYHYESFIISNDPGIRFYTLCLAVRDKLPKLKNAIKHYSKEEYIEISNSLSKEIRCLSPHMGTYQVNEWIKNENTIKELIEEESNLQYKSENFAIRLFFSKYLKFQEDKYKYPQLFCWPGVCFTNEKSTGLTLEEVEILFNRHQALFIDNIDGDIYPIIFEAYKDENIMDTFNQFFACNATYDMVRKWIIEEGNFTYNYEWLTTKYSKDETKLWVCNNFKSVFNIHPDEITII